MVLAVIAKFTGKKKNIVGNNGTSRNFFTHDIGQNTYTLSIQAHTQI